MLSKANTQAREQEMANIEKLHQQDIRATLSRDPKALIDLWTDDGVLFEPGGQAKIGKQAIGAEVEKAIAENPGMKVLTYVPEIKEVKVTDGWAFEWGYFSSSYKDSPSDQAKSFRGKMVRIMRKQSDGSWKFARVMWNLAE
jgi:uncharacterized protein (TIGR02246 family)